MPSSGRLPRIQLAPSPQPRHARSVQTPWPYPGSSLAWSSSRRGSAVASLVRCGWRCGAAGLACGRLLGHTVCVGRGRGASNGAFTAGLPFWCCRPFLVELEREKRKGHHLFGGDGPLVELAFAVRLATSPRARRQVNADAGKEEAKQQTAEHEAAIMPQPPVVGDWGLGIGGIGGW